MTLRSLKKREEVLKPGAMPCPGGCLCGGPRWHRGKSLVATSPVVRLHLPLHLPFIPLLPLPSDLRHVNDMFLKTHAGFECF